MGTDKDPKSASAPSSGSPTDPRDKLLLLWESEANYFRAEYDKFCLWTAQLHAELGCASYNIHGESVEDGWARYRAEILHKVKSENEVAHPRREAEGGAQ